MKMKTDRMLTLVSIAMSLIAGVLSTLGDQKYMDDEIKRRVLELNNEEDTDD